MTKQESVSYFLGIDWGIKKIGLAIADDELRIASALAEISAENFEREIDKLKDNYTITIIILGWTEPKDKFSVANQELIAQMQEKLEAKGFTVELEQEAFSTKLAQQNKTAAGHADISHSDNAEAARIILQSWLDRQP